MVAKREPSLTTISNTTLYNNLKSTITTAIFSSIREFFYKHSHHPYTIPFVDLGTWEICGRQWLPSYTKQVDAPIVPSTSQLCNSFVYFVY